MRFLQKEACLLSLFPVFTACSRNRIVDSTTVAHSIDTSVGEDGTVFFLAPGLSPCALLANSELKLKMGFQHTAYKRQI